MLVCSNFTDYQDTFCVANLADCPVTSMKIQNHNQFELDGSDGVKPNTQNTSEVRYRFFDL